MSPVERYLDALFDALSGTGAAGRRALAEADDHLRAATAEGVAAGLSVDDAERAAVARFGRPGAIAAELRLARGHSPLAAVVGVAWLLTGLLVAGVGATYLAKAVNIAVLGRSDLYLDRNAPALGANASLGWVLVLVGVAVLVLREIARRAGRLPALSRRVTLVVSAGLGAVGLALLAVTPLREHPDPLFGLDPGPGYHYAVLAAGVALLMAAGGVVRSVRRASRPV